MATPRVIQRVINRLAQARYATFWNCLLQLDQVLEDARKLAARMDDSGKVPWWVATPADLRRATNRVETTLRTLSKSGKRWEAELISRDWRK